MFETTNQVWTCFQSCPSTHFAGILVGTSIWVSYSWWLIRRNRDGAEKHRKIKPTQCRNTEDRKQLLGMFFLLHYINIHIYIYYIYICTYTIYIYIYYIYTIPFSKLTWPWHVLGLEDEWISMGWFPKKRGHKKKKRSSPSFHGKAIMKIPKISQLSQYVSRLNAMSLA